MRFKSSQDRGLEWASIRGRHYRPETGFVENWQAALGQTVDRFLPFSSLQDVNSDYFNRFDGTLPSDPIKTRNQQLKAMVDDGVIPSAAYEMFSQRKPRAGKSTDWNKLAKWVNENLKEEVEPLVTNEEIQEKMIAELHNRDAYAEDIMGRANAWGMVGQFAGGMHASVLDPVTIATLPLAAPVKGIQATSRAAYAAHVSMRTAAIQAGMQVPLEGFVYDWNEQIDLDYTLTDAMINITASGLLGGITAFPSAALGWSGLDPDLRAKGIYRAFYSKDIDEVKKALEEVGVPKEQIDDLAEHQVELNQSVKDPLAEAGVELKKKSEERPDVQLTQEELALVKRVEQVEQAEKQLAKLEAEERTVQKKAKKKEAKAKKKAKEADEEVEDFVKKVQELEKKSAIQKDKAEKSKTQKEIAAAKKAAKEADRKAKAAATEAKKVAAAEAKKAAKAKANAEAARKKMEEEPDIEAPLEKEQPDPNASLASDVEENGRGMMTLNDGSRLRVQKNEFDSYDVWEGKDVLAEGFDSVEEALEEFVGVTKPRQPMNVKQTVDNLEETQEWLNKYGAELNDFEDPLIGAESLDLLDREFENIGDDVEFWDGEQMMPVTSLVDEQLSIEEMIDEGLECLIG